MKKLYLRLVLQSCSPDQAMCTVTHSLLSMANPAVSRVMTSLRPCSHHRFETRTVLEPFQLPVFRPVPLRPLVPERADHLAM